MTKQRLFEYAVIYHPKPTKEQRDADESPKSTIVVPLNSTLAFDEKEVGMRVARALPEEYTDKFDSIEILIRPL